MLTIVRNPGGEPRITKIIDALPHFGVDIRRTGHCPEMTPEETFQRRKERRRQLQMQREAER